MMYKEYAIAIKSKYQHKHATCESKSHGFICTRGRGHDTGNHEAGVDNIGLINDTFILAEWDDEE